MIYRSAGFRKQWKRLPKEVKHKAETCLVLLVSNEFDITLNNHKLSGKYGEYRSINITGDTRIMYQRISNDFYLMGIGTHSELYK
jgi:addiction module RelE/StbE family toxin